ncbi:D-arabinose 1-dehydrogenase-like Zn-dependent alcohol dehydrogenase [Neobacillus niacini]|uniref:zinc-dependent alcohol dehydrogenase family protein n=1 Tax=Neobacillus niacini TaxID=86668 RepID=UPI00285D90A6|nr:zinc-dependent alcohol dehydrogenase family protein [Neobacillus niacini]MDR7075733.1 D-arabinose 1-dehydrogenase-like Zn-dependent alcohol dehydrogenase [Neobacillus niacini]
MKALLMEEVGRPMTVQNVADPTLSPDGVIIKVEASGVCRSDWHFWKGDMEMRAPLPHVLGHEFTGIVEEVGSHVTQFKRGDRVVVPPIQADNTCPYCLNGHQNLCDNKYTLGVRQWGGFAEFALIPKAEGNLVKLPESIDFVSAASLGCRFVTSYYGMIDQIKVQAGEWVVVHGCGGIGLSAIQIANAIGANVIAVDIADDKLELARSLGAVYTINGMKENAVEAVKEITKDGANVSVDALGITATCQNAILSLGKRGRHLQIGVTTKEEKGFIPVPIDEIVTKELQIIGSVTMPISRYTPMLHLIDTLNIQPSKLVTERISLDQAGDVFEAMSSFSNIGISVVDRF